MAKKKSSKSARRKIMKVVDKKSLSANYWWQWFVSILLIVIFIYGLWKIFVDFEWESGLSIIVAELIIVLLVKLYYRLKRK